MSERRKNEDLTNLIISLTPTEKRYFRIFAAKNTLKGRNIKLDLFDRISKQVQQAENDTVKLSRNNFVPHLKNQLHELLMRCLRNFHENSTVRSKVNLMLEEVEVLNRKSLLGQCVVCLSKAEKLCTDYELWDLNISVQLWKLKVVTKINWDSTLYRSALAEIERSGKEINCRLFYMGKCYEILAMLKAERKIKDAKSVAMFKHIKPPAESDTFAHYYYFNAWVIYKQLMSGKKTEILKMYEEFYGYIQTRKKWIDENKTPYANIIHNLAVLLFENKKYERSAFYLNEIMKLKFNNTQEYIRAKEMYLKILTIYCKIGDVSKINDVIPEAELYLSDENNGLSLYDECVTHLNIADACIISGQFKKGLAHVNEVLNHSAEVITKSYIYKLALLIRLIIYWEMKDTDTSHYVLRNTTNFFNKNKSGTEGFILKYLTLLFNEKKPDKIHALMVSFRKELVKFRKNSQENQLLTNFDFLSWVESKIDGRSFAEIVREKAKVVKG